MGGDDVDGCPEGRGRSTPCQPMVPPCAHAAVAACVSSKPRAAVGKKLPLLLADVLALPAAALLPAGNVLVPQVSPQRFWGSPTGGIFATIHSRGLSGREQLQVESWASLWQRLLAQPVIGRDARHFSIVSWPMQPTGCLLMLVFGPGCVWLEVLPPHAWRK